MLRTRSLVVKIIEIKGQKKKANLEHSNYFANKNKSN